MKNVGDIVAEYLIANGYDGLFNDDCGCVLADLGPCCECFCGCSAGHFVHHTTAEECESIADHMPCRCVGERPEKPTCAE